MKPNTQYRVVTVKLLVPKDTWDHGGGSDGISGILDTPDGLIADWGYVEADGGPKWVSGKEPEEGDWLNV